MYGESSTQAMAAFLAAVRDDDREAVEKTDMPDLGDPAVLAAMAPSPDRCACPPAIRTRWIRRRSIS